MSINQWFCREHPQEFLVNGECRICFRNINWQAKFAAGREYWKNVLENKLEYDRRRRAATRVAETAE